MDLMKYLQKRARLVELQMSKLFPERIEPKILTDACRHLFKAGGKRIRPVLTLASAEAVGGKAEDALEAAAALEFLHTFTLIHDDIMDRDEFRRGVKTVHMIWGEPIAIVSGDALFAKVFEGITANVKRLGLSLRRATEVFATVSRASFEICQGQTLDMVFANRKRVSEEEYMRMISLKTGALMEASTRVGAILGGGKPREVESLSRYGRLLGIAFQIRDDVLGVAGEEKKFGKPVGGDIREGKRTLLVVRALEVSPPRKRSRLLQILGKRDASGKDVKEAISILRDSGAIDYAVEKSSELIERAKSELRALKDSEAKDFLLELADFTIAREI